MMTIDSALFYLYEKVKNDKNSKDTEIEAINALIEYVNNYKKESKRNTLFAKLYTIYFSILLDHFKDFEFAQKQIQKDLSNTFDYHAETLKVKINNYELNSFLKSIGISDKPHYFLTDEENKKETELLEENRENLLKNINKWDSEKVKKALQIQISEASNRFKHYD